MKRTVLLLFSCLCLSLAFSQVAYEQRLEIELKDGFQSESILPLGENGFLMRSVSEKKENLEKEWRYEFFDSDLQSQGTQRLKLHKKFNIRDSYTLNHINHSLFFNRRTGAYSLLSLDAKNNQRELVEWEMGRKHVVKDMKILGEYAFMHVQARKKAYIYVREWRGKQARFVPVLIKGIPQKRIKIERIQLIEKQQEVFVYLQAQINKKTAETWLLKLDQEGRKKSLIKLSESSGRMLKGVTASISQDGPTIFTGTYAKKYGSESEGLFLASYKGAKEDFIRFYKFDELDNFFNYLSPKKQAKRERKKKRKEARGKELKSLYRIASHEIRELDDGYLFLGEAYYPTIEQNVKLPLRPVRMELP